MSLAPDESHAETLVPAITGLLGRSRWFGGKGRAFEVTGLRSVQLRPDDAPAGPAEPRVTVVLVSLAYADRGTDLYQVPLASYADPQPHLAHALVTTTEHAHVYDALHDGAATRQWLAAFAATGPEEGGAHGAPHEGVAFRRTGARPLDTSATPKLFSGEQSNSSVAFGDSALMKVFRRITPGTNPDVEIHAALTAAGSDAVAPLFGWVELADPDGDEPFHLAMLQQLLPGATDGWDLALASARATVGGAAPGSDDADDFTADARRLGVAVSEIHVLLREQFGTSSFDAPATGAAMRERLAAAADVVPALAEHAPALERVLDRLGDAAGETQRVHGDLHLGQTLRTALDGGHDWKLVDFEGEPLKTLAERRLPDSPWRDVAGMLRSFDYAARSVLKELPGTATPEQAARAADWLERNRAAFLDGYVARRLQDGGAPLTSDETDLIDCYEADKAVYEVLYEARNRPGWLDIPLAAIERIGAAR